MAEFYVELKENEAGAHVIHFSTCSDLPQAEQVKYLGSIATFDSANKKGKGLYHAVQACPTCAGQYAGA